MACISRLNTGATPSRDPFRAIPGAVPSLAFRPRGICAFAPRCPDRFDPCDASEPDLYPAGNARARCFLYAAANAAMLIR
jgi:ABC-type dipeptide/oligopeptide/nickel transport system ATPase component